MNLYSGVTTIRLYSACLREARGSGFRVDQSYTTIHHHESLTVTLDGAKLISADPSREMQTLYSPTCTYEVNQYWASHAVAATQLVTLVAQHFTV